MNLIEARQQVDLKVISIEMAYRAHRGPGHMGIGRRGRANRSTGHMGIGRGRRVQKKLEMMGIREGAVIRKVSQQAFRGPIIVEVGSMRLAIGFFMAMAIKVEEID
ncbi:ferrous iron transport protein A [candidate division WOR-3 bacterium]|nr:ferrous iron transport protein A [candidate division WOR-3 bacterium]